MSKQTYPFKIEDHYFDLIKYNNLFVKFLKMCVLKKLTLNNKKATQNCEAFLLFINF